MKYKNGVNYVTISNPKDPYLDYAFIDSDDSIAEAVFDLRDISVETVRVFSNPCINLQIVVCRVKKQDKKLFSECMHILRACMLSDGTGTSDKYCRWMVGVGREILLEYRKRQ